jgi:hypothetical protein
VAVDLADPGWSHGQAVKKRSLIQVAIGQHGSGRGLEPDYSPRSFLERDLGFECRMGGVIGGDGIDQPRGQGCLQLASVGNAS